ncbi:Putative vgr related protein [Minicystis rosea]|nr:Putative vgr related protein [Minicystis rosea]
MSGNIQVTVASGDSLDIREFSVHEAMSSLFNISLTVVCENPDVDLEAVVGKEASFSLHGRVEGSSRARTWTGICNELHQVRAEDSGLSTYRLQIVPTLWLTAQRRNHRIFQMISELDIVLKILSEWGIEPTKKLTSSYKKRKFIVQYGETDFVFMSRMLEDAGISFYFEEEKGETKLVLSDAPQKNEARKPAVAFRDEPTVADREHITGVRFGRQVRPGKYTMRDVDYRRPASYKLLASAAKPEAGVEEKLERFHYVPGAFLFESEKGDETPSADDKGKHRTDEAEGSTLAQKRLDAARGDAFTCSFSTNVIDLSPGTVCTTLDHPHSALGSDKRLLVVESQIDGTREDELHHHVEVRSAEQAYRPKVQTPKPKVTGVESATVVGAAGEEIHTDEFGRVRVHFHWDRESQMDDNSSCWIPVSQPWGGAGYGGSNLPRVGQEVIVDFLGGDPNRPVVIGRVYTNLQKTPYKLPANKTQSGWKSNSTNNTGGYNEIMMEDSSGNELLRMQAEKDMHSLIKNDKQETVLRDRTRNTKRNEDVTIGKNLSKQVVENEREITGQNRSVAVGVNRSTQIGNIDSTIVGAIHSMMVMPPGEQGPAPGTGHVIIDDKITISTKSGASIVLEGTKITLTADNIVLTGKKGVIQTAEAGDMVIKGTPKVKINP